MKDSDNIFLSKLRLAFTVDKSCNLAAFSAGAAEQKREKALNGTKLPFYWGQNMQRAYKGID